tara:strand:- start:127 stop:1260 length:1134 start_codon:yes stop_codon:yes gene_type:complete
MKGWIYKISHKDAVTGKNNFPGYCYIGQTRVTIKDRWNQHRNACQKYEASKNSRRRGKHADLYETMSVIRISNFIIEEIAQHENENENELVTILEKSEGNFIEKYNSIANGWNAKKATRSAVRNLDVESLSQKAAKTGLSYSSLRHRVQSLGESVEDAINHLKKKMTLIYSYKRQSYKTIREIAESTIHNPNRLNKATIEQRIRKLRSENQINEVINNEKNQLSLILIEEIFAPVKTREISVKTPDGDTIIGNKKDVHVKLLERYPDLVPETYQTIIARGNKANWSLEQAFGLEYPPDLFPVKRLIETDGYAWANGQKPNFVTQDGKPVVLHETKEIFPNQTQFADAYGLTKDMVSDYLNVKKMTPEAFLKYKGLTL